jgi:hypothetical protein|tara:strand:+ start:454 stop:804 length:351 start_codon:yes stop_codon:yes gene_type:complete
MADIRIIPGDGVMQFSASTAQTAFITGSALNFTISSSTEVSIRSDIGVSVSSSFILTGSAATDPFIVNMPTVAGATAKLKVNTQGITVFGAPGSTPTPVEGGIYYKSGVFYVGDDS